MLHAIAEIPSMSTPSSPAQVADGEWVGYDDVDTVCAKLRFAQSHGEGEQLG